jgi:hypothetical protein
VGRDTKVTQLLSRRLIADAWHPKVAFDVPVDEAMRWNMIGKKLGHDIIHQ